MTISFWVIILAVLAYGALHSWLASLGLKAWVAAHCGRAATRLYRLVYNLVAVITLLPVLLLPVVLMDKEIYRIPYPWVFLTVLAQVLAVFLLVVGLLQTGLMNFIGVCQLLQREGEPEPKLVVTGLYRYIRHPLYTAGLVFIWLMPWMTWNLLALNIGITIYILIGAILEERKLLKEYGEVYSEYRKKTPMLIPGLRFNLRRS